MESRRCLGDHGGDASERAALMVVAETATIRAGAMVIVLVETTGVALAGCFAALNVALVVVSPVQGHLLFPTDRSGGTAIESAARGVGEASGADKDFLQAFRLISRPEKFKHRPLYVCKASRQEAGVS